MLRPLVTLWLSASFALALAAPLTLSSPNGHVQLTFTADAHEHLQYSIAHHGRVRLEPAPIGVRVDDRDLGASANLGQPRTRTLSEVFPWRGNKRTATNHCQVFEIPVQTQDGPQWTLEARVFDDGAAFRYRVPGTGARRITGESTAWQLPTQSSVWFQTDTRNYEGVYQTTAAGQVPLEQEVERKQRPVHLGLPMTIAFPDGGFGLINEAALYHYSGLSLRPQGGARFHATFEDDPNGWTHDGPLLSPWRVVLLANDLNALVNSDVIPALCDPPDPRLFPQGIDTPWIRPGKAPCTWMVYGNDGAQWDRQKWFVDVSAATGCEYLLVDAGWRSERWGWLRNGGDLWQRTAELCRYAAERNVGIVLWHSYPEGRDDGPGLTTVEAREELFRNCQQAGVKGVKIDFFDSESKATIAAYEDLLRRSAKYQLMINFHGANKPTGEARTWPHEVTREGIREQEYVLWDSLPLPHYGALPFTRMAVGHADFLPGYVQPKFLKNTTTIFQMASVIVFSSPFLCWPDNPEAYLHHPMLEFVRNVPVTWDETRILPDSVIGDTVVMARRKDAAWYVAALNCRREARSLELDLSTLELSGKEWTVYRDGPSATACQIESALQAPPGNRLTTHLLPGGGLIVRIAPPHQFSGWK